MRRYVLLVLVAFIAALSATSADDPYTSFKRSPSAQNAFAYLHQVATHPRCANCHGVVDHRGHHPTVGDDRVAHPMSITSRNNIALRPTEHGFVQERNAVGMSCRDCHRDSNGREGGMPPGAANDEMPGFVWHMPPAGMVTDGLSPAELCYLWLDPARNSSHLAQRGGRDDLETFRAEFLDHHAKIDPLVQWAWNPGPDRTPAPGSHEDFVEAMKVWIAAGAPCPS